MQYESKNLKKQLSDTFNIFSSEPITFQSYLCIDKYLKTLKHSSITKKLIESYEIRNANDIDIMKTISKFNIYSKINNELSDISWLYYQYLSFFPKSLKKAKEKISNITKISNEKKRNNEAKTIFIKAKDFAKEIQKTKSKIPEFFSDSAFKKVFKTFHIHIINYIVGKEKNEKNDMKKNLTYDENKGIFYFDDMPINIKLQDRETNQSKIMKYIFIDNKKILNSDFFYGDMAENFEDDRDIEKSKNWSKYRTALKELNLKICDDFFLYNSSNQGHTKINSKYLVDKI